MLKNRRTVLTAFLVAGVAWVTAAEAQLKLPFKRRTSTAEAAQSMELTQADGPWLIMCASFNGERGLQQAMQLTSELRNDHGLNAYVYRHMFDHGDKIQGSGWTIPADEAGLPEYTQWKSVREDVYEQAAVVIGDFPAIDDESARRTLQAVKSLNPRSMMNTGYVDTNQSPEQQYRTHGRGPLAAAFLMPNPMLPAEYFKALDVDPLVEQMNRGVKYSLLKCPGQYSVRVATFSGKKIWNVTDKQVDEATRELEQKRRSRRGEEDSKLADAAYKANVLCRALRKKGVEAWEFHDRGESYVCVGSFEWATRKDRNGKDELNPEVVDVIQQYKGVRRQYGGSTALVPRTIAAFQDHDLQFDVQPMPVLVPKLGVSSGRRSGGIFGR
jgi:hypothetical protein